MGNAWFIGALSRGPEQRGKVLAEIEIASLASPNTFQVVVIDFTNETLLVEETVELEALITTKLKYRIPRSVKRWAIIMAATGAATVNIYHSLDGERDPNLRFTNLDLLFTGGIGAARVQPLQLLASLPGWAQSPRLLTAAHLSSQPV